MHVIYADLVFVLNGGMDYLALCCTTALTGFPVRQRRLLLAAALGGLYGVLALIFSWEYPLMALITAGAMVYLVFGRERWYFRRLVLFLLVSSALAGICTMLQTIWMRASSPWIIFGVSALSAWFALSVVFRGGAGGQGDLVRAELCHEGRCIRLMLLRDTGNTLRDAATGQIFCILYERAVESFLKGTEPSLQSIDYTSLGKENGQMQWFYCDAITVDGVTHYRYPVALTGQSLSDGRGFVGLWNGEGRRTDV